MAHLIECVPNFSEGRDPAVVASIRSALDSVPGAHVLDVHMDADHHRSVITLAGEAEAVLEAAVRGVVKAADLIDLNRHQGVHPRIGAADVVPFIPVEWPTPQSPQESLTESAASESASGARLEPGMAECIRIAHRAGQEIFRRSGVPVYFYGAAAARFGRGLSALRRGGVQGLIRALERDPAFRPDVPEHGEARLHPTAGATAVGVRPALIAFNILLASGSLEQARQIARAVRASSGGLPEVQAMGVLLRARGAGSSKGSAQQATVLGGQPQVSMNLTNFRRTSLQEVYRAVTREAERSGIRLGSSELVGLIPAAALQGIDPQEVGLVDFDPKMILENRLADAGCI